MTPTEINIAIAEACGWTWFSWGQAPDETNRFIAPPDKPLGVKMIPCARPSHGTPCNLSEVPNYHGSLDAMHEAEKFIQRDGQPIGERAQAWDRYVANLFIVCTGHPLDDGNDESHDVIDATAAQRAEAFLLTVGN